MNELELNIPPSCLLLARFLSLPVTSKATHASVSTANVDVKKFSIFQIPRDVHVHLPRLAQTYVVQSTVRSLNLKRMCSSNRGPASAYLDAALVDRGDRTAWSEPYTETYEKRQRSLRSTRRRRGASSPKAPNVEKVLEMDWDVSTSGAMLQRKPRPSLGRRAGPPPSSKLTSPENWEGEQQHLPIGQTMCTSELIAMAKVQTCPRKSTRGLHTSPVLMKISPCPLGSHGWSPDACLHRYSSP